MSLFFAEVKQSLNETISSATYQETGVGLLERADFHCTVVAHMETICHLHMRGVTVKKTPYKPHLFVVSFTA